MFYIIIINTWNDMLGELFELQQRIGELRERFNRERGWVLTNLVYKSILANHFVFYVCYVNKKYSDDFEDEVSVCLSEYDIYSARIDGLKRMYEESKIRITPSIPVETTFGDFPTPDKEEVFVIRIPRIFFHDSPEITKLLSTLELVLKKEQERLHKIQEIEF